MNIEICQADLFIPELLTLMNQLDAYQSALYTPTKAITRNLSIVWLR
ncbi:putative histone acetyltransferase HPA2 and acetyltransferase [Yersinia enterocolitica]|nr:putative histone acetyltransferase HPA2 and acetyltransferase [Yersinia enterocolitica]